ncbi:glycerol acyltransferase [Parafrankia soli]|uniref:Glycerol acyltransferase n=1 Tax=Parafrankia soli TaxID=2599596 RepID=A0A1S1Q449_9ACTN|nr:lysophospholipid acyltransferase family protein [Parafrankia soli]OHV28261.1 glycerol acyltransferase [Parafrankia soli]
MAYWLIKVLVVGPLLGLLGRPAVTGAEHIPRHGPVILAGNHLAVADSFFLVRLVPRRITFLTKQEYFTGRGVRGRLVRWFFTAAVRVLEAGGAWGIYPEGTRSPDGRLYRGRTGVARVALATGAPVVPVVLKGTEAVSPRGRRCWRRGRVQIIVGRPLDFSRYRRVLADGPPGCPAPTERMVIRSATDELMRVLADHSGQEYVDAYATDHRGPDPHA